MTNRTNYTLLGVVIGCFLAGLSIADPIEPKSVALLTMRWPDGSSTHEGATTMGACEAAAQAALRGISVPEEKRGQRPIETRCDPATPAEAGFKPGWDCISGYNCGRRPPR